MEMNNAYGIVFRRLAQEDLSLLEKWYNRTDCFGYATGFRDFSDIKEKLYDPLKMDAWIAMIDRSEDNLTIGFIYGEIKKVEIKTVLWINILIIEPVYQHKGHGTSAVKKLLHSAQVQYGPLTCIVAVSDQNSQGLSFWKKLGFSRSESMEDSLNQLGNSHVAIFKKDLA